MDYKKFVSLLAKGETQNIDFKIECNAFGKGNERDTAELIKDIIAFSNNGNIANYMIIGVSDGCNGFKSVDNINLTDDNLQVLIRDNIFPIPKVKLIKCNWSDPTDTRHKNITFVIIQIGPQARQCFRFSKDHINYEKKFVFKKNEVWIRRQATSDIASPEEVKRQVEGKEAIAYDSPENNVEYLRLSKFEYKEAILSDLKEFLKIVNGKYEEFVYESKYYTQKAQRVWVDLNGEKICLFVLIVQKCTSSNSIFDICRNITSLHHGVIILSTGSVAVTAIGTCPIKIKENWGYFCTSNNTNLGRKLLQLPTTPCDYYINHDNQTFCLVIDKITNTQILNKKMQQALSCLNEKDDINGYAKNIKQAINCCLTQWLDSQCVTESNKTPGKKLKSTEFVDKEKYGDKIMMLNPDKCVKISEFLN